jgi:23S rRNA pseudouridine2605 synthase
VADRLQKALAAAGYGSRREIERWIQLGRITVNGQLATLGVRVGPDSQICLDGRPIRLNRPSGQHQHLLYYKPAGEVTTRRDEAGRATVFDRLPDPRQGRWISIGRLDIATTGLLLLTTDGELAHRLMHPSYRIPRRYAVRLAGQPTAEQLRQLTSGVPLDGEQSRFEGVQPRGGRGRNVWYRVTLRRGRYREVRRLFEAVGLTVSRLIRISFGPIVLDEGLRRGDSRPLNPNEVSSLYGAVNLDEP